MDSTSSNPLARRPVLGISKFQPRAILNLGSTSQDGYAVSFDTTYTQVVYIYRVKDTDLHPPTVLSYDQYRELRLKADFDKQRRDETRKVYKRTAEQRGGEGIAIDVPFKIKSKTFRRLFGGDNVGVRVQGNITINGSLRRQKSDQLQAANQRNTNTSFRIDMVQQFSITGKVGQKVEVKVDQDSERLFDFENSLRLTYTGDQDEIVQKVEAGNVNLNLGTRLATFSGKNTGLFGLKSELKFGPLSVTGIASLERGQKNRQRPNQQGQNRTQFNERQFVQDIYFWLTSVSTYRDSTGATHDDLPNYRENYRRYQNREHLAMPTPQQIQWIEVFVSSGPESNPNDPTEYSGRAAAMQFYQDLWVSDSAFNALKTADSRNYAQLTWRRLQRDVQYTFDAQLGYLRLKQAVQPSQYLACAFSTLNGDTFGTLVGNLRQQRLILLRSNDPSVNDSTWDLMFRHVYGMGATSLDPNSFKITISRASASNNLGETGPPVGGFCGGASTCTYLSFFGFDLEQAQGGGGGPDGQIDDHGSIRNFALGEIQFLDLTPFNPSGYTNNGEFIVSPLVALDSTVDSGQFIAPNLYVQKPTSFTGTPLWRFETEYKGSSSVFNLGPLVLEGSEEVTLNGAPLQRGNDYTIDYASGELRILNEAAKAQGADLEITFESGQIFQLDKKTLLGARAEYELWDQSYIGGMVLHLNEKTLDKRVRIGSEPIRNTLYDANTRLHFAPNFLSRMVDAIPLIHTEQGSELVIDGEVAKVFPNPNSLENPRTGDYNGLAYIDDFEGSRRATPLGLLRRMWNVSSPPADVQQGLLDPRRGRIRWWNPNTRDQVPVREVFPEREVNSQVANTLQSLKIEFTPDTADSRPPERSWGGVMRYLGQGYSDQSKAQYLELWVKLPGNPQGKMIIDLGEISEDAIPNQRMDSEDRSATPVQDPRLTQEYGNGLLDTNPDEDTGLDGQFGTDPADSAYWNGPNQPKVPSWDDWEHGSNNDDFSKVNGTERSRNDESGTYPDTEDLNDDDELNTTNNYFSYTIDLSFNNPYIVGGQDNINNWRLFRIPIASTDTSARRTIGTPDLTSVKWARFYVTGMSHKTTLEIVQLDIVSNEWLPRTSTIDSTEYVSAAVINTHENPGYVSPPGVEGAIDPITRLRQREQSLVLKINNLDNLPGGAPDEFFLVKDLHQVLNLLEYKRLKMFVHGGGEDVTRFHDGLYQLVLRFGQSSGDIQNNYYDIVMPVKAGWDPQNAIDVTLNEVSLMHARRDSALADTVNYPDLTEGGRFAWARPDTPSPYDSLVIKGNPSFSRVYYVALGVRLVPGKVRIRSGDEIWVDELRVSDIYRDPGTAGDFSASLRLADFVTLQGGYSTRDADFHNINVRTGAQQAGGQASQTTVRGNATIAMQKFGLDRYGFQLPVTLAYSDNTSIPKYIPNTDSRVDPRHAPEDIKGKQQSLSYTVRYSKSGNSRNPFVRWSLEKLNLGWDYNFDRAHDFNTLRSRGETSSATAGYNFPTAKGRGIAPLWFMKQVPVLSLLGNPHIFYKPTKLQFTARADKRDEFHETRQGQLTTNKLFTTVRGINTGFNFINPLTTDYTRSHKGVLASNDWADLLQYDFGRTNEVQQNLTNNYSPQLTSWLRPTFNYTTTYGWTWRNFGQRNGQSISNSRNMGVDLQLDLRAILGGGGGGSRGRGSGRGDDRGGGRGNSQLPGGPQGAQPHGTPPGMMPGGEFEPPMPGMPPDTLHNSDPRLPGRGQIPGQMPRFPADSTQQHGADTTSVVQGDTTQQAPPKARVSLGERLGSVFNPIKQALLILDPITLSLDNTAQHSVGGTIGQASLAYQLGLSQDPKLPFDPTAAANPMRRKDQSFTGRSGIRFTPDIRTTLNYGYRTGENIQGTIPSGTIEKTEFWLAGKKGSPTRFPFVDISADWGGLEKLPFLSRVAQSVALNSAVANKVTEQWSNRRAEIQQREHNRQWNPFLGVNFTWKGNIDSQVRYNTSSRFTEMVRTNTKNRTTEQTITATVSYTIRTGFRIPVLWLSTLKLQNQTTFSLNGDYRSTKAEHTTEAGSDVYTPDNGSQTAWSLQPRMTYSFSNTVQGQAYVQIQQTKQTVTGVKTRTFEFGIQVNIAIRG